MLNASEGIPFLKMHGAGNDFVIFDNRSGACRFSKEQIIHMADRRYGIGCDQLVLLETSTIATVFMRLYNADGGEVNACGNATRCIGWLMMEETGKSHVTVETKAGVLGVDRAGENHVKVNMGAPRFDWREIPLSREVDTQNIPYLQIGKLHEGFALNMGNPHIVFFLDDVDAADMKTNAPKVERNELFPERTNVEVAQVMNRGEMKLRVWERGVGETLACGTGACATMVAARVRGLVDSIVQIHASGGTLELEWQGEDIKSTDDVWLTGPVALIFSGTWVEELP